MVRMSKILLRFFGIVFTVGVLAGASATQAQMICELRDKISETLKQDYAEVPVSAGLDTAGRMIEVFASDDGNWTILMTLPSGMSCLMATGKNWTRRKLEKVTDKGLPL